MNAMWAVEQLDGFVTMIEELSEHERRARNGSTDDTRRVDELDKELRRREPIMRQIENGISPGLGDYVGDEWEWSVRWQAARSAALQAAGLHEYGPEVRARLQVDAPAFWGRDGKGDGFRAATVCRRRHEHDLSLETYPGTELGFCATCGANLLSACPSCGKRLRGTSRTVTPRPGRSPAYETYRWGFCDGCGEPYPWANREELISQLQNILDQEEAVSDHDRLAIMEDLDRLKVLEPGEDARTERRLLATVKRGAPGFTRGLAAELLTKLIGEATFS